MNHDASLSASGFFNSLLEDTDLAGKRCKGRITNALNVVFSDGKKNGYFRLFLGQERAKKLQPKFMGIAPFLYLIYVRKMELWPLQIRRAGFARQLLRIAEDETQLMEIVKGYKVVRSRLAKRGVASCPLNITLEGADAVFGFDPLPQEVLELIT